MSSRPVNYMRKRGRTGLGGAGSAVRDGFSEATIEWLDSTPIDDRKALGQYMTPHHVRETLLDAVDTSARDVLDPSVGTGEFLTSLQARNPDCRMVGWDIDPKIADVAARAVPAAEIRVLDALKSECNGDFDLVLGNPPYFQFTGEPSIRQRFAEVISGRPNIFALFFQIGLECLREGGQLAYVVPTSMNSGAYFEALRQHIIRNAEIERLLPVTGADVFADAQTTVQIIVLRKGTSSRNNVFEKRLPGGNLRTAFSTDAEAMRSMFIGNHTLDELGYTVSTGQVVWNQARDRLRATPDRPETVRLVWARDIADGRLGDPQSDAEKHSYVRSENPLRGPALVVNRIVGSAGKARLRAALVPEGMPFVGENHVNVVTPVPGRPQLVTLARLCDLLRAPETGERLARITGNTQVSATELNHLLPVSIK